MTTTLVINGSACPKQRAPRRKSLLERLIADNTLSLVKRNAAKYELGSAYSRTSDNRADEAATMTGLVSRTAAEKERAIQREAERRHREEVIARIQALLREKGALMTDERRRALEKELEEELARAEEDVEHREKANTTEIVRGEEEADYSPEVEEENGSAHIKTPELGSADFSASNSAEEAAGIDPVVARNRARYEDTISRNEEWARREAEIRELERQLRLGWLTWSKKKRTMLAELITRLRRELEEDMAEAAQKEKEESCLPGEGATPPEEEEEIKEEMKEESIATPKSQEEFASHVAQIDRGGGGGGWRRRISLSGSTMVIDAVIVDDSHPTSPDTFFLRRGSVDSSRRGSFCSSIRSDTFCIGDTTHELVIEDTPRDLSEHHPLENLKEFFVKDSSEELVTNEEEKEIQDAMDTIVKARIKAGRPLRRLSCTECSLMSNSEREIEGEEWEPPQMDFFYKPKSKEVVDDCVENSSEHSNSEETTPNIHVAASTSAIDEVATSVSVSSTDDVETLNDGPYSKRRPSYISDDEITVPRDNLEKQNPVIPKSIMKNVNPYRPPRRGSGIHSDEFEQWNPKVSELSRKLYLLQKEAEAREESMKEMSAELRSKEVKNKKYIQKLLKSASQDINKESICPYCKERLLQFRNWQEKAATLSKKVYDLELLLEEQEQGMNDLLEFKDIQAERIKALEEELKQKSERSDQIMEKDTAPEKKKLARRASLDSHMQKQIRRASSCKSVEEQVQEETKLEISALESRLAKVNAEQAELQRELETMRALAENTRQVEPKYEEEVIVRVTERHVTRERLIYQLSCRQCKGKNLNFVGTTLLPVMEQVDIHFQEVVQQVQKMNGRGRRVDSVFVEGMHSTKWSATFAQHFAEHCRKKCKCAKDVLKYCQNNVKIEILKKESGASLYWNDYE